MNYPFCIHDILSEKIKCDATDAIKRNCFTISKYRRNWFESRNACVGTGGILSHPRDERTQNILGAMLTNHQNGNGSLWIGGKAEYEQWKWLWIKGKETEI